MVFIPKFIIAAAVFFSAYCLTRLGVGELHLDLGMTLPGLAILFLAGAWFEGYLSRGGLQRFIQRELPPIVRNKLLGI